MVKVAMITPYFVRCGIASYSEQLSHAIAQEGHEVYIVRLPRFGRKVSTTLEHVAMNIPSDVDVIHVQHEYGLYATLEKFLYDPLKTQEKPIVTTMHAVGNWSLDHIINESSDRVVVHNQFCAGKLTFPTDIIPHGCKPVESMPREEAKEALGIPTNIPVVGYLGYISPYKGLEILIDAVEKIPKAGVLIGGGWHTGPDTAYIEVLRQKANVQLPGRCQWYGFVPEDDLVKVYSAMDLLIYPSRFVTESGALLTALSHGKASIVSNMAAFREKRDVGAVKIFKTTTGLTRSIRDLLRHGEKLEKLENGAKRYALANAWSPNIARKHIELYGDLLD